MNDFLLVECMLNVGPIRLLPSLKQVSDGFILDKNRFDMLPLDDLFCQNIIGDQDNRLLANTGYLG